jgi:hypothetical protein
MVTRSLPRSFTSSSTAFLIDVRTAALRPPVRRAGAVFEAMLTV